MSKSLQDSNTGTCGMKIAKGKGLSSKRETRLLLMQLFSDFPAQSPFGIVIIAWLGFAVSQSRRYVSSHSYMSQTVRNFNAYPYPIE